MEDCLKRFLCGKTVYLAENSIPLILNHIDCFVSQCRGNESIHTVNIYPHALNGHSDDAWDKFGQAIGNLRRSALSEFIISMILA
jgi:hypothetical protein